MARSNRRRLRWYDIAANRTVLASAAGGSIAQEILLTETQIEELGGGMTLMRIIGDIYLSRVGTAPVVQMVIVAQHAQAAASKVAGYYGPANVEDNAEEMGTLWNRLWADVDLSFSGTHVPVDIRRRIKLQQGMEVALYLENWTLSAAADNASYLYHLRCLVALP